MNPAQQARTEGFLASLAVRGVPVFLGPGQVEFCALVEPVTPDGGEFALAREEANAARIHILRAHLGGNQIGKGAVFRTADQSTTFRVTEVEDNPVNVAVVFTAELAAAE